jgi:hypothetical protein
MPIMKWELLTDVMEEVKKEGYLNEVSTDILHNIIAKKVGFSMSTRISIMKSLAEFNFIKPKSLNVWSILYKTEAEKKQEKIDDAFK